jgi:hypothetical protein
MQTQTGVPLVPSGPVSPEERSRAYRQRMEQEAHLAWFGRGTPIPLALLAQRTRTTVANAGGIDDPQTAIAFSPSFMRDEDVACWTPQGPIRLEGKVGSGEAASFPGRRGGRWSIPRGGRGGNRCGCVFVLRWEGRRKLSGPHRFRHQLMSQRTARRFQVH